MAELARIAGLLETSFKGDPYYGPSVLGALEHVTADVAARKIGKAHSIWELVVHLTAELAFAVVIIKGTAGTWVTKAKRPGERSATPLRMPGTRRLESLKERILRSSERSDDSMIASSTRNQRYAKLVLRDVA